MSLATPLSLASFADLINAASVEFPIEHNLERSLPGDGTPQRSSRAPAMRMAKLTSPPMPVADAEGLLVIINALEGLDPFLLYNKRMPYPSSDPTGSIFGAATPIVGTITNRRLVAFTGFPNDYVIPRGTYFQIIFDTSRYYLGQFAEAKTANGSGAVSAAKITPPLPASIDPGDAVTVLKPSAKFLPVLPAMLSEVGIVNATISFSAEQTYEQ